MRCIVTRGGGGGGGGRSGSGLGGGEHFGGQLLLHRLELVDSPVLINWRTLDISLWSTLSPPSLN